MKKYIAELTESGLYNLVEVKKETLCSCYMLNGKKVFDKIIVDQNGDERLLRPCKGGYKEFDDLEECQNFIAYMNRY